MKSSTKHSVMGGLILSLSVIDIVVICNSISDRTLMISVICLLVKFMVACLFFDMAYQRSLFKSKVAEFFDRRSSKLRLQIKRYNEWVNRDD